MKKRIISMILAATMSIIGVIPTLAAPKSETVFGLVLNSKGDGIVLDQGTLQPVDPIFNYIHYTGYAPGQYIITFATLDAEGEWEERTDYVAPVPNATETELTGFRREAHYAGLLD